jgi:hypothetical protein
MYNVIFVYFNWDKKKDWREKGYCIFVFLLLIKEKEIVMRRKNKEMPQPQSQMSNLQ